MLDKLTILVVEDSDDLRRDLITMLRFVYESQEDRHVEILGAEDGKAALSIIKQNPPNLMITDIMMPVMDGFELIEHVKEDAKLRHIPIIVLTGKGEKADRKLGLKLGADDYLTKPFDAEDIILRFNIMIRILDLEHDLRQVLEEENRNLKSVIQTMQPVFISYSHKDESYAQILATSLRQHGFDVWIDDRISQGDKWFQTIVSAIENCAAFIVIMTPDSEKSEWVHKEILLAKREKKKIFPLLLKGKEFAILIDIQFYDVQDYKLPDESFFTVLEEHLAENNPPERPVG